MMPIMSAAFVSATVAIVVTHAISTSIAEPISFKTCGPNNVIGVDLSPCPVQPCVFHHGVNATMKIKFKSELDSTNVTSHVFGIVEGVPVPFPLPNEDACVDSGIKCPVTKNTQYLYDSVLPVKKDYPNIRLAVMWKILGDKSEELVCIVFPIEIVN